MEMLKVNWSELGVKEELYGLARLLVESYLSDAESAVSIGDVQTALEKFGKAQVRARPIFNSSNVRVDILDDSYVQNICHQIDVKILEEKTAEMDRDLEISAGYRESIKAFSGEFK